MHNDSERCIHILFVMVKVLRVPPANPLTWQTALTDREVEEVLRCSTVNPSLNASRQAGNAKKPKELNGGEPGAVKRKELEEDEPCPICYETLACEDDRHLVWCHKGCGKSVHGKSVWSIHQGR